VIRHEVTEIPSGKVIIASGPLTSNCLAEKIALLLPDKSYLSFYDAAAPIVTYDSIDMSSAYFASRYSKGSPDYINCPLNAEEYSVFYNELINAETAELNDFEKGKVFEGCLPIEVMAKRGVDTMRYGPLKPIGLPDPATGETPYAVIQLRKDNADGTLYNLVGFQTNLKWGEQKRVLTKIPALKNAEFTRYGVMHRNTFISSPMLLDRYYRYKNDPDIRFAGQITGVEGYVESAASGLLAGIETAREMLGKPPVDFPSSTAIGALALYISTASTGDFQPMNINFGIIDSLGVKIKGKRNKNQAISERSLEVIDNLTKKVEKFED
jgi:methylenetetrahydrofolate--tRNA-(uracil-5-)-methyltransferase